ncbi:uncharacterized protein LOC62_04G006096 [Vanrija pseudolonga]|uniref:AB hydrolase-1 domain-containing protein n=1 Tax=Vanrija pseudolonga TaxID=143232 RepID=A0AAF1BIS3_9TREE|nr:hypothetical protein LOC62_04G006096 [Vanrija pseudolonga]
MSLLTVDPSPLNDPQAYLSLFKFNRKLPKCPRTGLPVSYSDIGDPDGIPVLFVPPSGCTRWFSAPQDPLAAGFGLRLITVDRPGIGAVPPVPLADRIGTSCMMIESVLEHLGVKVAHVLATSAGVYCTVRLLSSHPGIFLTGLNPPPAVYLVSPWSPPLPASDPLAYRQMLDWVPSRVLATQDITLPYIVPAVKSMEDAYGATSRAVGSALGAVKSWWGGQPAPQSTEAAPQTVPNPDADGIPVPEEELETGEDEAPRGRLWAPSAKYLTMDYLYAEDFSGIGQEYLLCLNRGAQDSGPEWFKAELESVAASVRDAQDPKVSVKLDIMVWWGEQDGMVPVNGRTWLNKALSAHPKEIRLMVNNVPDGDHSDLMLRAAGIGEVYTMIMTQGDSTDPKFRDAEALAMESAAAAAAEAKEAEASAKA